MVLALAALAGVVVYGLISDQITRENARETRAARARIRRELARHRDTER